MISCIILTWNSEKFINKCLGSLIASLRRQDGPWEIIAVDNASKDDTPQILREFEKSGEIKLIINDENRGTSAARNQAVKVATGEFLLFLDSDTEFNESVLPELFGVFKSNARAAIVAPAVVSSDGKIRKSFKKFPTLPVKLLKASPFGFLKKAGSLLEEYKPGEIASFPAAVDYCISACWLVSRQAMEKIGEFDEKIFYAPEDVDYCLRAALLKLETVYCPAVSIIHLEQRITYRNPAIARKHWQGLKYFFRKHGFMLSRRKIYKKIKKAIAEL